MRLKLDENIAASAAVRLSALGHDVHTVLDEGLGGRSDVDVWRAAQAESRLLVTQDLDFSDERRFAAGSHAGILLVRLRTMAHLGLPRRMVLRVRCELLGAVLRGGDAEQGPGSSPRSGLSLG